jgi:DNA-binding transcriptional ArsR family regulator
VTAAPPALFAVLADETRWRILTELGAAEMSASALATRLPVTRQAIAKHLSVLAEAGLVEPVRAGREIRFRALGAQLSALGAELAVIGQQWDRRLMAIKRIAESGHNSP